jgi:hypothetical protein
MELALLQRSMGRRILRQGAEKSQIFAKSNATESSRAGRTSAQHMA